MINRSKRIIETGEIRLVGCMCEDSSDVQHYMRLRRKDLERIKIKREPIKVN